LTFGLIAVLPVAWPATAEAAPGTGAPGAASPQTKAAETVIMIATMHDDKGKEIEREFDISDPKQAAELNEAIQHGHVVELKKKEKPDLFLLKRWDLGVWSILIFVALYFVLAKLAWKPMIEGLNKREENIRGALEQAERTRKEAMELQSQLDAKMKAAGGEIAKMMDEARRDAQGLKDQMVSEAKSEIQSERDRLHREIDTAKDQALQEIWQQAVTLATTMSTKAIRRNLTAEDHRRLLDETLAELKTSGGGSRYS
jgi:F-type H+-transporting ATPase subunit b